MGLQLDQVTLSVLGRVLIRGLSAQVDAGQVLAVMGPSGSGKSTLLAFVAGTLEAPFEAQGRVRLHGEDVTAWPVERRRIGLLFQDDLLFPHLSVLGNLLFALPSGARAARIDAAHAALARAGLDAFAPRMPSSLSGGQRSRVSLLRALLAQPAALLLDEPFSKLDTALREQMREFTFSLLAERSVPALLVTHDAADIPAGAQTIRLSDA